MAGLIKTPVEARARTRSAFNAILAHKLFQRGQIYTWTREAKERAFREAGINAVVNFWPKIDPDLADIGLDWSWQISRPRSEGMLDPYVELAARSVADYLDHGRVLVLCEAGKTRSVFFCILVVHFELGVSYTEAKEIVLSAVPAAELKGFMLDWLAR